jgi:predicted phosphodiesterase
MSRLGAVAAAVLAAAVGFALLMQGSAAPAAAADRQDFKPFSFAHGGDPQMGAKGLAIDGCRDRFVEVARRARHDGAQFLAVCGDFVDVPDSTDQLAALADALKALPLPLAPAVGNHDDAADFSKRFGQLHCVITVNNCDFIIINSCPLAPKQATAQTGEQAQEELLWMTQALQESVLAGRTHLFVLAHHPPSMYGELEGLFADAVKAAGVKAIFCGHTHTTKEANCGDVPVYITGGTANINDANGMGYRLVQVTEGGITQKYIRCRDLEASATQPASKAATQVSTRSTRPATQATGPSAATTRPLGRP